MKNVFRKISAAGNVRPTGRTAPARTAPKKDATVNSTASTSVHALPNAAGWCASLPAVPGNPRRPAYSRAFPFRERLHVAAFKTSTASHSNPSKTASRIPALIRSYGCAGTTTPPKPRTILATSKAGACRNHGTSTPQHNKCPSAVETSHPGITKKPSTAHPSPRINPASLNAVHPNVTS